MNKIIILLLSLCPLAGCPCAQAETETAIVLGEDAISVNGEAISADESEGVYLAHVTETHEDVPEELAGLENRVVVITKAGSYRISGSAQDAQIAVKAGAEDDVRLIMDGVSLSCRTNAAIAVYSAREPLTAGEYAVTIELAQGSENSISGSHNSIGDDDEGIEFDGAISSAVSLGIEGSGSLTIDADNEGIEVSGGHLTINGGNMHIEAGDDPLNVSEDGVGVLTMNDGYVFSAVHPDEGGEGDGIDSNGWIVFNGGTAINLAHPSSQDSGIDSDMGSTINGGVIVGAGNMYDPIGTESGQLFMMLEFAQATNDLVVVTDENDMPVFAYDFPHDYMYIAFSSPQLREGIYHVYLGGEIEGQQQDGLYTQITSYVPGTAMQHGAGKAQQRGMGGFGGQPGERPEGMEFPEGGVRPEMPDGMEFPEGGERPEMPEGMQFPEGGERPEMPEGMQFPEGGERPEMPEGMQFPEGGERPEGMEFSGGMGGFGGGMHGMESSAEIATTDFSLSFETTGFTNVRAAG